MKFKAVLVLAALASAVNLANADDEYAENEYISIEALARNWNIYFG